MGLYMIHMTRPVRGCGVFMVTMFSEAYLQMLTRCSLNDLKWLLDDVGEGDCEMGRAYREEIGRRTVPRGEFKGGS
jgi:hypothetical protein